MPSTEAQNVNLFAQVFNGIQNALGKDVNLQINLTPQTFNYPVAPIGSMDPSVYQFVSTMPKYSPMGTFSNLDAKFFDSYGQVLSHVKFEVSPDKQAALNSLRDQWTKAQNEVTQMNSNINLAYQTAKQSGGEVFAAQYPDVTSWLTNDPVGVGMTKQKADLQKAASQQGQLYTDMLAAEAPQSYQAALNAMKMPSGSPTGPTVRGWTRVNDASGVPQWQPEYVVGNTGQDWRAELTKGSQGAMSIEIDASKTDSKFNKTWANGSSSYGNFFWGVEGSGGWSELNISQDDSSLKCTIKCESSTLVNVNPGAWYDSGLMRNLGQGAGQGYTLSDGFSVKGPQPQAFGQDGVLPTRIAQILVVYKPSFKITCSTSTYKKYEKTITGGGGLRIGPFHFGGHGGSHTENVVTGNGSNTFESASTSEVPLILGVTVAFPGLE